MSFYIQNKQTDTIRSSEKSFGVVQNMQQTQADKVAREREKEQEKTSSQEDTVTISDEARLIIDSQLGKIQAKEHSGRVFMSATEADQLAKQVSKAQGEIDDANNAKNKGIIEEDETSYKAPKAEADEEVTDPVQVKIDAMKSQIEGVQEQIKAKQSQLAELVQDTSPEAQEKTKMIQAEIGRLGGIVGGYQEELNELLASQV